jgi:hypothetical protein
MYVSLPLTLHLLVLQGFGHYSTFVFDAKDLRLLYSLPEVHISLFLFVEQVMWKIAVWRFTADGN